MVPMRVLSLVSDLRGCLTREAPGRSRTFDWKVAPPSACVCVKSRKEKSTCVPSCDSVMPV